MSANINDFKNLREFLNKKLEIKNNGLIDQSKRSKSVDILFGASVARIFDKDKSGLDFFMPKSQGNLIEITNPLLRNASKFISLSGNKTIFDALSKTDFEASEVEISRLFKELNEDLIKDETFQTFLPTQKARLLMDYRFRLIGMLTENASNSIKGSKDEEKLKKNILKNNINTVTDINKKLGNSEMNDARLSELSEKTDSLSGSFSKVTDSVVPSFLGVGISKGIVFAKGIVSKNIPDVVFDEFKIDEKNVYTDQTLMKKFEDFLKKEHSEENLDFLISIRKLNEKYKPDHLDSEQLAKDLGLIYEKFIPLKSPREINIPASLKTELALIKENNALSLSSFSTVVKEIQGLVRNDPVNRFMKTVEYKEYVYKENLKLLQGNIRDSKSSLMEQLSAVVQAHMEHPIKTEKELNNSKMQLVATISNVVTNEPNRETQVVLLKGLTQLGLDKKTTVELEDKIKTIEKEMQEIRMNEAREQAKKVKIKAQLPSYESLNPSKKTELSKAEKTKESITRLSKTEETEGPITRPRRGA